MKKIVIYSTTYCPYCVRAKELFKSKGVTYQEINLDKHPEEKDEMINKTNGALTVPQIFIDDQYIGDCDKIMELNRQGKLDSLLS